VGVEGPYRVLSRDLADGKKVKVEEPEKKGAEADKAKAEQAKAEQAKGDQAKADADKAKAK